MAQREGSVYLSLFIVAMLLFVLTAVAFFFAYNRQEEISRKLAAAQRQSQEKADQNRELSEELDRLKKLIAGTNIDAVNSADEGELEKFKQSELVDVAQAAIGTALKDLGRQEVAFTYLTEPYGLIAGLFQQYREQRDTAYAQEKEQSSQLSSSLKEHKTAIDDLTRQLATRSQELAEAQQKSEDCESRYQVEKEKFVREVAELQDERLDLEIRMGRAKQQYLNQISTLQSKIVRLEREKKKGTEFAELEPDGRLQKVVSELRKGWIDLGRQDHLMTGLVFQVYQVVKGGKKLPKGRVEVRRVMENAAEVRILEETDPLNPINDGDYVASPFYDKAEKPIFVFAGQELESRSITKEFLEAKLADYGVQLRSSVDINTTFLVALKDYQKTIEYRMAQEIGVPLLRERDVLEFIGY